MVNLNKHTKTKSKPKPTHKFRNCSHVCAYHCAQLLYKIQHRTVLIIFPPNLQTIIKAQMLSTGGNRVKGFSELWRRNQWWRRKKKGVNQELKYF